MAQATQIPLHPPQSFNFKTPDQWSRWKKRFEQFRLASGLNKESGERQASALLYCLGDDAEDVLLSSEISDEDRKDYAKVVSTFDGYFQVRKNVIFERARFNCRSQRDG